MSPQRKGSKRGTTWKPPRDRRELVIAVLASLTVVVVTLALVWFLRPNRSGETSTVDTTPVTTPTTVAGETTTLPTVTTLPTDSTVAPTTAPAPTSTS